MDAPAVEIQAPVAPAVEQYLTLADAAGRLSVSPVFIRGLERRGELPGVRVGGRLRFAASEINRYLARAANAPRRLPPPELLAAGGRPPKRRRR